jgi:hypothetical protein
MHINAWYYFIRNEKKRAHGWLLQNIKFIETILYYIMHICVVYNCNNTRFFHYNIHVCVVVFEN